MGSDIVVNHTVVTLDNFEQAIVAISAEGIVALDTETTGVREADTPFALVLSTHAMNYYFDSRLVPWQGNPAIARVLLQPKTWVFQNAKFDMRMLEAAGLPLPEGEIHDIAIMARIVDNTHLSYSLESQAKRFGHEQKIDVKSKIKELDLYESRTTALGEVIKEPRYDRLPLDIIAPYACQDGLVTLQLWDHYMDQLDEKEQALFANEAKLTRVCYKMERLGVKVDLAYVMEAFEYERAEAQKHKDMFRQMTGLEYVNSADQLCPIFEKLGERIKYTQKGSLSLTDDILETYTTPLAQVVRDIRYFDKRVSTYYSTYLDEVGLDGRIHPTMWQAGTRTGRFSYSNPNLQNIPKEDDGKYHVRRCFVPDALRLFVSLDYSQMEYRMMAGYANEKSVIKAVMDGADFHQVTADMVGISRRDAKTLNFAVLYGAGLDKIAHMLKCSRDAAKRMKTKFYLSLPRVEEFVGAVIRTGKGRGYVTNWSGRKMRADYEFCFALPNHLIQGGGADVVKKAMVRIHEELPHLRMVLQVHDQLVFELLPSELVHVPRIKEIMESIWSKNGMSLTVDIEHSFNSFDSEDMVKGLPA